MAKRYRPVPRDQAFLFPPDMREWLPPDHPVWLVITVVEDHLDTSAFHAARKTGGAGTAGYDPDMLLALLTWAYAHKVTSSRRIEELCRTDVAFRVICAGDAPDHSTVARFRGDFPGGIGEFFTRVLMLCAALGMGRLGTVALDGTKIAASASKSANRAEGTLRKLAAQSVVAHAAADAADDALFGEGNRGDEVPEDAWRAGSRAERIAAALASLEAERAAAAARREALAREHLAAARAGRPRSGARPPEAEAELAQLNLGKVRAGVQALFDDWHARNAASLAAAGRPLTGPRPVPPGQHCRVREAAEKLERARARAAQAQARAAERDKNRTGPGPVRNITDPDSRLMPVRGGGFLQGYNAQNVTSADGLVIATELTRDTTDTGWFEPMLGQAEDAARLITSCQPPATAHNHAPHDHAPHDHAPHDGAPHDDAPHDDAPHDDAPHDDAPHDDAPHDDAPHDDAPHDGAPGGGGGDGSPIGLLLADAGYLSEHNLTIAGPDRLIATGKHRNLEKAARDGDPGPAWNQPLIAAMAARLQTTAGITAYRQRGHIAETPHGNIKHNMGFRQLTMRGKAKADAEWRFACSVHNLFKAITAGKLTTAALAALPRPAR
jgi:transposase